MLGITNKKKSLPTPSAPKSDQASLALMIANRYLKWIWVVVAGVVLFVGYTFFLDHQIREAQDAASESLPTKLKTLDDLKSIQVKLDEALADFDALRTRKKDALDRIAQLLPHDSKYGDLYTELDAMTAANGFKLLALSVTPPSDKAAAPQPLGGETTQVSGAADDPVAAGLVRTVEIQMQVEGDSSYEAYKKFLDSLERNTRLMDVASVSVDGSQFMPQADNATTTAQYTFSLTTYYQP